MAVGERREELRNILMKELAAWRASNVVTASCAFGAEKHPHAGQLFSVQ